MYYILFLLPLTLHALDCSVQDVREDCIQACCGWCVSRNACYKFNSTSCPEDLDSDLYQECTNTMDGGIDGLIAILIIASTIGACACILCILSLLVKLGLRCYTMCSGRSGFAEVWLPQTTWGYYLMLDFWGCIEMLVFTPGYFNFPNVSTLYWLTKYGEWSDCWHIAIMAICPGRLWESYLGRCK